MMGSRRFSLENEQKELMIFRISGQLDERPEIVFAFINGYFLDEGDFGDIDLALFVNLSCPAAEDKALEYELEMEIFLEYVACFPVDVRILNQSPQPFRYSVLKNGLRNP